MIKKKHQTASLCVLLQLLILLQHSNILIKSLSISPPAGSGGTKSGSNQLLSSVGHVARNIQLVQPLQQTTYLSPPSSTSGVGNNGGGQQMQQQQPSTLPPPLITTIAQNNYLDSLAHQLQQSQNKQYINNQPLAQPQQQQQQQASTAANEQQRSSYLDEHDDSVPLATINNHSRNNQPPIRPPQYVDVSALVGRDRNSGINNISLSTTSSLTLNGGSSMIAQQHSNSISGNGLTNGGSSGLTAKSRSGLPECATQQVCNAIFVRMNYTQRLCECSSNYNWKCSHNLDPQDGHTIELTRKFDKRIYTQIKTCEPLREVRACKSPTDWTLLALQSERSGKAHYVVVCKCPTWAQLEGPYTHNHPPYANIPGIRVYGMLCAHQTARSSAQTYAAYNPALSIYPEFPWSEALNVLNTTNLLSTLESPH